MLTNYEHIMTLTYSAVPFKQLHSNPSPSTSQHSTRLLTAVSASTVMALVSFDDSVSLSASLSFAETESTFVCVVSVAVGDVVVAVASTVAVVDAVDAEVNPCLLLTCEIFFLFFTTTALWRVETLRS